MLLPQFSHWLRCASFVAAWCYTLAAQAQYAEEFPMAYLPGLKAVRHEGKVGVIDAEGEAVIPLLYDLDPTPSAYEPTVDDSFYRTFMIDGEYSYVHPQQLIVLKQEGRYGLFSPGGTQILPCAYNYLQTIDLGEATPDGSALLVKTPAVILLEKEQWYIYNISSRRRTPPLDEFIGLTNAEGWIAMRQNGRVVYVDATPQIRNRIPDEYTGGQHLLVYDPRTHQQGLFTAEGNMLVPIAYDFINDYSKEHPAGYTVYRGPQCGFLNPQKKLIVPIEYDDIIPASGVLLLRQAEKWALSNADGQPLTGFVYDQLTAVPDTQRIAFRVGQRTGYLDPTGREVWD